MLESFGERLADAVHHGYGSFHPLLVRKLHDLEPAIGSSFLFRDEVAYALHENLATATRNRIETSSSELANDVAGIHSEGLGKEIDLRRAEAVDVNRVIVLYVSEEVEVPVKWDVGIVSAL